jgi:hypothetical protein
VDVTDSPLQVFQARIQNFQTDAVQMHVWRAQMNIMRQITRCQQTNNYAPIVAQVIKARGTYIADIRKWRTVCKK